MVFRTVLEVVGVYLIVTQIVAPLIRGTRLFPYFRKEQQLRHDMSEVRQVLREEELKEELTQLKEKENKETNAS